MLRRAWENHLNAPWSTAVGRLFDAAAALVLGIVHTSYEAQGPMQLEAIAAPAAEVPALPMTLDAGGLLRVDWAPLIDVLCDATRSAAERAGHFHDALARTILLIAEGERAKRGDFAVGLTGGVFQNRRLTEAAQTAPGAGGFSRAPGRGAALQRCRHRVRTDRRGGCGGCRTMIDILIAAYLRYANRSAMQLEPLPADRSLPPPDPARRYLLYVHVPFCPALCPFCSFHRVVLRDDKARRYFAALRTQLRQYAEAGFRVGSVYVGGGTPTAVPDELEHTLELINELFGRQSFSVETNPSDLTPAVTGMLRRAGVERLSVGVQSFDDGLLRAMGRYEKYGSAAAIREHLAAVADTFPTLNIDMIFNLPGQTRSMLERDLDILAGELRAQQVSFYPLMVAGSTRLAMRERMGGYGANREREYYRLIQRRLAADYRASSAWCFSRGKAAIDEYIVTDDEYLGAGSGAFGYYQGLLYSNTFSLNRYAQLTGTWRSPVTMARRNERARADALRFPHAPVRSVARQGVRPTQVRPALRAPPVAGDRFLSGHRCAARHGLAPRAHRARHVLLGGDDAGVLHRREPLSRADAAQYSS